MGLMTRKPPAKRPRAHRPQKGPTPGPSAPPAGAPGTLAATQLAPLLNDYTVKAGPVRTIAIPHAGSLTGLLEVTVSGRLLPKQVVALDLKTGKRTASRLGDGSYKTSADGDVHLCLGTRPGQVHIACEVQNGKPWAATFNAAIGQDIVVTGFFRSLFEHPGFSSNDDAHVFEVHPVRAVTIAGKVIPFDVDVPDQPSIHTWSSPNDLNQQDQAIRVVSSDDTLTFTHMDGSDENYVRVSGTVTNVRIPDAAAGPAKFTFISPQIGRPLEALCLQGTRAIKQLGQVGAGATVAMIALRNIDLASAARGLYVISLLAIDIQPAA